MKRIIDVLLMGVAVLLIGATVPSCVTAGDLDELARTVRDIEVVAADESATVEDVEDQLEETARTVEEIKARVVKRSEGFLNELRNGIPADPISLLAVLGLHLYRNSTRKKDLASIPRDEAGPEVQPPA